MLENAPDRIVIEGVNSYEPFYIIAPHTPNARRLTPAPLLGEKLKVLLIYAYKKENTSLLYLRTDAPEEISLKTEPPGYTYHDVRCSLRGRSLEDVHFFGGSAGMRVVINDHEKSLTLTNFEAKKDLIFVTRKVLKTVYRQLKFLKGTLPTDLVVDPYNGFYPTFIRGSAHLFDKMRLIYVDFEELVKNLEDNREKTAWILRPDKAA